MKKFTLLATALLAFIAFQPNIAHASDEATIEHYEAQEFENSEEAYNGLISTSNEMATVAADSELDVTKMEKIHQISYTTENAVAVLKNR